ncbi:MAG TPA: Wzz/FepE/Etk N-terminal domain-containing protein [Jatrophihabitans sp.]|uniref:Wzz/FepE/Etk N-terminal domain-containing protein n=1 Tax=Jatrophihabitans sp. TaxID=1932789 RepID=UPI002F1DAEF5
MTGKALAGPPGSSSGQSVVTIGQFFSILRRRLLLVLTLVLLGILAAGALLLATPKTYEATAVVDISPTSSSSSSSTVSTITESRIVTSTSVTLAARETLAFAGTPTELAERVTVTSPLASQFLNITYAADSPQGAADGANAFAHAYLDYRTQIAQKDITLRIGRIQSQVADLQKRLTDLKTSQNDPQRGLLQNQIQQLQNQLNNYQTSVISPGQVAGAALKPASPSSPRPVLYLAGGVLFGLLAGIILSVLRDRRDDRVRNAAELEQSLGYPVLAESVTAESGSRTGPLAAIDANRSPEADAYRTITTTVTADAVDSRIVLLCGAGLEGLSLAPLNLAATFAMQGLQTVIAGPRHAVEPAIDLLGVPSPLPTPGLRLVDQLAPSATLPRLSVLSLGDEVSLGAALRANGDRLDDVLAKADVIVLDGVNIELPSTSLRLAQLADEAVVVAYRNRSTHAGTERLARQLAQVNTTVLGGILLTRRSGLHSRFGLRGSAGARRAAPSHRESVAARVDPSPSEQVTATLPVPALYRPTGHTAAPSDSEAPISPAGTGSSRSASKS